MQSCISFICLVVLLTSAPAIQARENPQVRKSAVAASQQPAMQQNRPERKEDIETIKFGLDGRSWLGLNDLPDEGKLEKLLLVRGIYDGLMFGQSVILDFYYTKTSYEHLMRALDQFYGDYRNEKILVVYALRVISMELKGASKGEVELELSKLRRMASRH